MADLVARGAVVARSDAPGASGETFTVAPGVVEARVPF